MTEEGSPTVENRFSEDADASEPLSSAEQVSAQPSAAEGDAEGNETHAGDDVEDEGGGFGDDFDDFEEGGGEDDFGDFDDGFQQHEESIQEAPSQPPPPPSQPAFVSSARPITLVELHRIQIFGLQCT